MKNRLRDFFRMHPGTSFRVDDLAAALKLKRDSVTLMKRALRHLVSENVICKTKGKRYTAVARGHMRTGTYDAGVFGAGFVATDTGTLYVPPGSSGTALPGDTIRVEILARRAGPNPEARVIDILKRVKHEIVGEYSPGNGGGFVQPDVEYLKRGVFIPGRKIRNARPGQRVAVRITDWENEYVNPRGEITEVIGFPGERGVAALSIAHEAGIPLKFPTKVLREADMLGDFSCSAGVDGRRDFREEEIFTIDPEDARDFDDAVSLRRLRGGLYRLGVYIADVSAYVQEGSALDREAARRGTSVYLVDKVVPMLPERLSNDLCSLVPRRDRPVFAVIMTCKPDGEIVSHEIVEGVISSRYRFSYSEAQAVIEGKKRSPHRDTLRKMNTFAKTLRTRRFKQGGVDFLTQEVEFTLDKNGAPLALSVKPLFETNLLIEEFMLLANRVAAHEKNLLERKYRRSLPYLYRVHEEPDDESVREFAELVGSLGFSDTRDRGSSPWFQKVMRFFADKPERAFIEEVALRSMMKAIYHPANSGHFGLGFAEYTHFTSPIRRYPDLVVHRLLKRYAGGVKPRDLGVLSRKMSLIGKRATEQEIRAQRAEREVTKLKKLEFMVDKVGDIFRGVVSGVTSFGLFVQLEDILVEGLVHVRDIGDDFYLYEEGKYRLVGERSGKVYKLGDKLTVQVIKVNVDRRHLDLIPLPQSNRPGE